MNLNKVFLAGNLTRDPELVYTQNNTPVCKFGMAINRKWTNKQSGQTQEETTFVDCTAWAKVGELISQNLRKGSPIFIEGRITFEQWTSKDNQPRSKHSITVDNFQFVGPRQDAPPQQQHGQQGQQGQQQPQGQQQSYGQQQPQGGQRTHPSQAGGGGYNPNPQQRPPDDVPF